MGHSKGKMRGQEWVVRSTDLSEVVDVRNTAKEWPGVRRAGPIDPQNEASKRQKAYCFDEHPGKNENFLENIVNRSCLIGIVDSFRVLFAARCFDG